MNSGRRSKKAEKAEDKALVKQALESAPSVRFTESPPCKYKITIKFP